jgi:hypothetical protein
MRPTPLTDALYVHCVRNPGPATSLVLKAHGQKLERLLGEARDVIAQARPDDFDDPNLIETTLARIDATLDPDCIEGPPRTREERVADARALDEVAPTPAEKIALMFRGTPNPDYVDAPMEVSVTTIDPATGEMKQGVATTDEELRKMFGILGHDRTMDELAKRYSAEEKERYFREYLRLADEVTPKRQMTAEEKTSLTGLVDHIAGIDDDLDEPLPPKQCGIDDPDCEACQ